MSMIDRQNEIIEEFSLFDDAMDRYQYIIDIGEQLTEMPEALKTDENMVKGCQSKVWVDVQIENEKLVVKADSNTVITKGIVGLLARVFTGAEKEEALQSNLFFLEKIKLSDMLSSQRSNGLANMIKTIQERVKSL